MSPSPRRARAGALAVLCALALPACTLDEGKGDPGDGRVVIDDPTAPPEEDAPPPSNPDLLRQVGDLHDITANRAVIRDQPGQPVSQLMAAVQGESMTDLGGSSVWGGAYRAFWADSSHAAFWVYSPNNSWRHLNMVGFATACSFAPWLNVSYSSGNHGGGIYGVPIGGGYASYFLGDVYLNAGWSYFELGMSGDQYQPGVCDANIFIDYFWIP